MSKSTEERLTDLETRTTALEQANAQAAGAPIATVTGGQITFPVPAGSPAGTTNSAAVAGTEFFAHVKITAPGYYQWGGQNAQASGVPIKAEWLRPDGTPLGIPGSSMSGQTLQNTGGAFNVAAGDYQIRGTSLNGEPVQGGFQVNYTTAPR